MKRNFKLSNIYAVITPKEKRKKTGQKNHLKRYWSRIFQKW